MWLRHQWPRNSGAKCKACQENNITQASPGGTKSSLHHYCLASLTSLRRGKLVACKLTGPHGHTAMSPQSQWATCATSAQGKQDLWLSTILRAKKRQGSIVGPSYFFFPPGHPVPTASCHLVNGNWIPVIWVLSPLSCPAPPHTVHYPRRKNSPAWLKVCLCISASWSVMAAPITKPNRA